MPDNSKSPPSEPSMEEIIASISRIISDEKRPAEPVRPVSGEKSDVLDLTEVVDEDGSVRRVTPADNPNTPSTEPAATVDPSVANATARSGSGPSHAEAGIARWRTLCATCSGRSCRRGSMNIFPALSRGWFGKRLSAWSVTQGCADPTTSHPRLLRGEPHGQPDQPLSRGQFSDAG